VRPVLGCKIACNIGSDAYSLLVERSRCTDQPCLQQVDIPPSIHLTFDEFEHCDLAFGLPVGPRRYDRGPDRLLVFCDAVPERSHEALRSALKPRRQLFHILLTDHGVEVGDDLTRIERWNALFDWQRL